LIKPDPATLQDFASVAKGFPAVVKYIDEWYQRELNKLPDIPVTNVARAQGRCQVLREVRDLIQKSPEYAAQLK
jgi:hypothetical protein